MIWFFAVLVVLVIGGVVVVATGTGDGLAPAYDDRPDVRVPADRPLLGDDLREIRFSTAVRGYRASEVDVLLERLARELDEQHRTGSADTSGPDGPAIPLTPPAPSSTPSAPVTAGEPRAPRDDGSAEADSGP